LEWIFLYLSKNHSKKIAKGMQKKEIDKIIIQNVKPRIGGGKFPVKRIPGEEVLVTAEVFTDGQDAISVNLLTREGNDKIWKANPMVHMQNDEWSAWFIVENVTDYYYTLEAWINLFKGWLRDFKKKVAAGSDDVIDLLSGAFLIEKNIPLAPGREQEYLRKVRDIITDGRRTYSRRKQAALDPELEKIMDRYPFKENLVEYEYTLKVTTERQKALFSSWYELFPRSAGKGSGTHGSFRDVEEMLPYISGMGFDILYLPPLHPIGLSKRKGKNNSLTPDPDDPGSPWAIGSSEGGHKAIHPQLGTLEDFKHLVRKAGEYGMEIALDIAFQCSPDHPYKKEHPEWFRERPDGSIQYAENPPKKYEDIYPFDFESEHRESLWKELKDVFLFWIDHGVRIFRVDNPHSKPFIFWEYVISEIKKDYPEILFLAEAFTRPKIMEHLARIGFSQSYTYFAWRNSKQELTEYMNKLTQTGLVEYFRPNFWPNTPDILTEYLQSGGRPAFIIRLVLAATLSSSYGIYGPAYELTENRALSMGSEEYLDSEKYQIRNWNLEDPASLKDIITRVNLIRRENSALHTFKNVTFHHVDNDQLICYSKASSDRKNVILTIVNLDPHHTHSGWVHIPQDDLGIEGGDQFQVMDLLSDAWYLWKNEWHYIELDPRVMPAHIFKVRKKVRSEKDFDYYL